MNNLERLYEAKKEFDKALKEIETEQSKMEDEIKEKRNIGWDKMFDDLYVLRKYSNFIDTGVELCKSKSETLGFEIRNDYVCVISWEHFDCDNRPIEPRTKTYFFDITKDEPFKTDSHYSDWMKYVITAIENWDEVKKEIEKRLANKMEREMNKKAFDSEQRQVKLEKQLKAISK